MKMKNLSKLELITTAIKYAGIPAGYLTYYAARSISPLSMHERERARGSLHEPFVADVERWLYNIAYYFGVNPHTDRMLRQASEQAALRHQIEQQIGEQVD